ATVGRGRPSPDGYALLACQSALFGAIEIKATEIGDDCDFPIRGEPRRRVGSKSRAASGPHRDGNMRIPDRALLIVRAEEGEASLRPQLCAHDLAAGPLRSERHAGAGIPELGAILGARQEARA